MGVIVRLLHPVMPFFTEDIWARLPHTEGFVTVAPYPSPDEFEGDAAVLDEVAILQETVTEVRRIRGEMEIAMRKKLILQVGDDGLLAALKVHQRGLLETAGVTVTRLDERPKGVATIVVRGVECVIPLGGVVDFEEEIKRLAKVIEKADKDVAQLDRRLNNPNFVDRAPEAVVAEVREKRETAAIRLVTLRESQARLLDAHS